MKQHKEYRAVLGREVPKDFAKFREMKYNEIICCEHLADWESAKQKVTEYLNDYPDDEAMQREAEFLETR